jgi:hypothetical protein
MLGKQNCTFIYQKINFEMIANAINAYDSLADFMALDPVKVVFMLPRTFKNGLKSFWKSNENLL